MARKYRNPLRYAVQGISLLGLHGFIFFAAAYQAIGAQWLCLPILSCHACPVTWTACPVGMLVHFAGWRIFPFAALGILIAFGALVGRFFCGWVCPFGIFQGLLYRIPSPKISLPAWTNYIKYAVLVLMVFAFPYFLGELTALSFCRICPAAAVQAVVPYWFTDGFSWGGTLMTVRFAFLVFVIFLAIVASRSFCRVFCPIGALMAPFNYLAFWRVRPKSKPCVVCKGCDRYCPTDVKPSERLTEGIDAHRVADCIVCHDCMTFCPSNRPAGKRAKRADRQDS